MSDIALVRPRLGAVLPHGWRQLNLAALTALTGYSTALGWQAQVVSYPLYRAVGEASSPPTTGSTTRRSRSW